MREMEGMKGRENMGHRDMEGVNGLERRKTMRIYHDGSGRAEERCKGEKINK